MSQGIRNPYFAPYSVDGREGYAIVNTEANVTYAAYVVMDAEGKVTAASISVNGGSVPEGARWTELNARDPGHWAYSMMTGTPSEALLDLVAVPHAERAARAADIFKQCGEAAERFLPNLHKDALAALVKAPEKRLGSYEFYAVDGERGLFRRQAAASYGIFADLFGANLSTKMAIDRKKPLNEILTPLLTQMAENPIGNAHLKRFAQASAVPEGFRLAPIVKFASAVQPDWFPKSEEEWSAFYSVATGLCDYMGVEPKALAPMIAGSAGKWAQLVDRCVDKAYPAADDPNRADPNYAVRVATYNTNDMIETFTDMVVLPLVAFSQEANDVYLNATIRKDAREWAWSILLEGRNIVDILDVSRRFHQERNAIMEHSTAHQAAQAKAQIEENGWPGLTMPIQAPNGRWLVPLTTPQALKMEGQRLSHCVGGYDRVSRECKSHIVSVQTLKDGHSTSHSTCEFAGITSAVPKLSVHQHRARSNSNPDAMSHDAMNWYIAGIETGRIPTRWDLIRAFLDNTLLDMDHVEKLCGYDWRERDNVNRAVQPWAGFVTKEYRKQNLDMMMDSDRAEGIRNEMTPAFLSAASAAAPAP